MQTESSVFQPDTVLVTASGRRLTLQAWLQLYAVDDRRLFVGTDSRQANGKTKFMTVIVSYLTGQGGTYAYASFETRRIQALRERLQMEAWKSIELALLVAQERPQNQITIHLDVNSNIRFRSGLWAPSLMGMVTAQGFDVEIKPRAFTATSLADALVRTC